MADLKISQLSDGGASQATDEYVIARSGNNYRIDGASVAAAATSVGTLTSLTVSGAVSATSTTDSSSTTTGAIVTAGGVGIAKKLYVGTELRAGNATDPVLISASGTYGIVSFNNTASTSTSLGIFGRINPGEALYYNVPTGYSHKFSINGATSLTLDASGNLGLGTSSPTDTGGFGRVVDVQGSTGAQVVCRDSDDTTKFARLSFDGGTTNVASVGAEGTATQVAFRAGGGEKMRLDASGNLGLGVTPSAWETASSKALQFTGGSIWSFSTSQLNLLQNAFYNTSGNLTYINNAAASAYRQISGVHSWYTAGAGTGTISFTQAMTLDASGNLGVGATSLGNYRLSLEGSNATVAVGLRMKDTGTSGREYTIRSDAGAFIIQDNTASAERARITSGGSFLMAANSVIGLNTSDGSDNGYLALVGAGADGENRGGGIYLHGNERSSEAGAVVLQAGNVATTGIVSFRTGAGTERARITSGGYFKASNTGTYHNATGPYHELYSTSDNNGVIVVKHAGASGAQYGISILTVNDQNDATRYFWACDGGGTERATLRSNGGLANYSANNVNLASDFRLKKDIAPLTSTWDKLKAIEVVNFRYKDCNDGDPALYGVIAQQVQPIVPELVVVTREAVEAKDAVLDEDGNEVEPAVEAKPEYYGIREQPMYWLAIKALQEAQARIEALEARLEALEA